MVFAEDSQGLLSLNQGEEIIRHSLAIEKVIYTEQEVPVEDADAC